jgi:hypothetical protein
MEQFERLLRSYPQWLVAMGYAENGSTKVLKTPGVGSTDTRDDT